MGNCCGGDSAPAVVSNEPTADNKPRRLLVADDDDNHRRRPLSQKQKHEQEELQRQAQQQKQVQQKNLLHQFDKHTSAIQLEEQALRTALEDAIHAFVAPRLSNPIGAQILFAFNLDEENGNHQHGAPPEYGWQLANPVDTRSSSSSSSINDDDSRNAAAGVGGGWKGVTLGLSMLLSPSSAMKQRSRKRRGGTSRASESAASTATATTPQRNSSTQSQSLTPSASLSNLSGSNSLITTTTTPSKQHHRHHRIPERSLLGLELANTSNFINFDCCRFSALPSSLRELDLSNNNIVIDQQRFFLRLCELPNLQSLNLSKNRFSDPDEQRGDAVHVDLSAFAQHLDSIEEVDLSGCTAENNNVVAFDFTSLPPPLLRLNLSQCNLCAADIGDILRQLPHADLKASSGVHGLDVLILNGNANIYGTITASMLLDQCGANLARLGVAECSRIDIDAETLVAADAVGSGSRTGSALAVPITINAVDTNYAANDGVSVQCDRFRVIA